LVIAQECAEAVMGWGEVRFQADGLAVLGDSLVQLAPLLQGLAEVQTRAGASRAEGNRNPVEADRLLQQRGLLVAEHFRHHAVDPELVRLPFLALPETI